MPDSAGMKQFITGLHESFPDLRFTIDDAIEEGDKVVGRWTMTGTHSAPFNGLPPTGDEVLLIGYDFLTVRDGRFAEVWHLEDNVAMLQALGLMPRGSVA
ncbi:MAG: ester cyclase [Acidimicrobiia bacterium]